MAEDVELELDDNEDSHLSSFFGGGTSTRSKSISPPLGGGYIQHTAGGAWAGFVLVHFAVIPRLRIRLLSSIYLLVCALQFAKLYCTCM